MKKHLLFLFCFLITNACNNCKNHTDYAKMNSELGQLIEKADTANNNSNYATVVALTSEADSLISNSANSNCFEDSLIKVLNIRGITYVHTGNFIKAWNDFQRSLAISEEKEEFKSEIFKSYWGLGVVFYYYKEGTQIASDYIKKAEKYATTIADRANLVYFKCESAINTGDTDTALFYLRILKKQYFNNSNGVYEPKDLSIIKMKPFIPEDEAKVLCLQSKQFFNAWDVFKKTNIKFNPVINETVIQNFEKAIEYTDPKDKYQLGFKNCHLGSYLVSNRFDLDSEHQRKAYQCLQKALKLSQDIQVKYIQSRVLLALSIYYRDYSNNHDSAYTCMQKL